MPPSENMLMASKSYIMKDQKVGRLGEGGGLAFLLSANLYL